MLQSIAYYTTRINKYWQNENYYGYIYLIYDQKTGLSYVGQKKGKIEDSLNYYGSGTIIQRIKNKRGIYFLKKIILGVCYSKKDLFEVEAECKLCFNTINFLYGYNLNLYDAQYLDHQSDEAKKKNSEAHQGEKHPNWGKNLSSETKLKISISVTKNHKINNNSGMKNKNHTEESKNKIGKSNKIKLKGRKTGKSWNKGLTKENNLVMQRISNSLKGRPAWNKGLTKENKKIKEASTKLSTWHKNKKWVKKNNKSTQISTNDVDSYLKNGWVLGRIIKGKNI